MISKIIEKEKGTQEAIFSHKMESDNSEVWKTVLGFKISQHKQSLINLKEYLEELFEGEMFFFTDGCESCKHSLQEGREQVARVKEDIKELNKMIKKYG